MNHLLFPRKHAVLCSSTLFYATVRRRMQQHAVLSLRGHVIEHVWLTMEPDESCASWKKLL